MPLLIKMVEGTFDGLMVHAEWQDVPGSSARPPCLVSSPRQNNVLYLGVD